MISKKTYFIYYCPRCERISKYKRYIHDGRVYCEICDGEMKFIDVIHKLIK